MKDAYSFDVNVEGLNRSYQAMYEAYQRIFHRCGVTVLACEADPGMMGGDVSHEFMAPSENGEDRIVQCSACGYAANLEAAKCPPAPRPASSAPEDARKPLELVKTPGQHTVEQVSRFLKVPASALIKTLIYDAGKDHVAVLVRGDHDVNEAKLARLIGSPRVQLSSAQTIERLSGAPVGFAGPVKLSGARLLADHAVMRMVNAVTGANQAEAHFINVNPERDVHPEAVGDLRVITADDPCPTCGTRIRFIAAIEVGHVFKLGTKYTQALKAEVQDPSGTVRPMIMGCYGIGVNRIVAAAIEQRHDANGIIWPLALAPFQVVVSTMESGNAEHAGVAGRCYDALGAEGVEVLLDDREQSPGSKLKDADLIGIPVNVVIGKVWQSDGQVEIGLRATKEKVRVPELQLVETIHKLLDKISTL